MDPINPLTGNPEAINQASTSQPPKIKNSLVLIMSILLMVAVAIAGLFYFQIQKLSKELSKYQIQPSSTPSATPTTNMKCVEKSSLNCSEEIELSYECTEKYQNWAKANCPGWAERVNCKNPRPQVCTYECIVNPPYICGSDGKSYCTVCQACSDKNVTWYETKDSPCEK